MFSITTLKMWGLELFWSVVLLFVSWESVCQRYSELKLKEYEVVSIVKPTRCTNFLNLFYFEVVFYMFRTVFPSIIRSLKMYIQHQEYVKQVQLLLVSKLEQSLNLFDIFLMLYVHSKTPDDGRKDRPKHVEHYFKIK